MKKFINKILFLVLVTTSFNGYAQLDSLKNSPLFIKHLTFKETFFGNEDMTRYVILKITDRYLFL